MIATDFSLLGIESDDATFPKDRLRCIHQDENVHLWYKPDNMFSMPKVNIMYSFTSGHVPLSPDAVVAAHLSELVQDQCNEFSYLACMAGLHCDVSRSALHVSGYSHKAHVLLKRLVDTLMYMMRNDKIVDPEVFDRVIFTISQQYQSFLVSQPYQHAIYGGDLVLEANSSTIFDKLNATKCITLEDVLGFAKGFWKYCRLSGLVHGDISAQQAYDMTSMVWRKSHPIHSNSMEATIPRAPCDKRVVDLSVRCTVSTDISTSFMYRFSECNDSNSNSCVQIMFQMRPLNIATNAKLAFVNHLIREPAFNQLRTEEQSGYIVHTSVQTSDDNIKGLLFLIQSDSFDPIHVEDRIDSEVFLAGFRQRIVEMSDEDFQTNVDTVVATFLEKTRI